MRPISTHVWALQLAAATLCSVLAHSFSAVAQQPGRPVTIIVPYTAGDNTPDILARTIAHELQQRWGQTFVVENKPGASGNIGTLAAARAVADGNTLLMAAPALAQNVGLFKNLPYDPVKDFAPIIEVAEVAIGLVVHPSASVSSTREFIQYVKAQPGRLNYSSPGIGTPHHLSMELFKIATGIDIKHIPYRGSGPAVQDLIGGHVSAMFLPLPVSVSLARGNQVKLLAVAERERAKIAPEVPTLTEEGIAGVEVGIWNGMLAPAGTPQAIIERYNVAIDEILRSPPIAKTLANQGINIVGGTSAHFSAVIASDVERWLKVVKRAGITGD